MSPLNHEPEALRWALKRSGMSQKELAEAIGKSPSYLSEMLKGTRNAKPAVLADIARALNCPLVALEAKHVAAA